jgi:DNA adenine methylase
MSSGRPRARSDTTPPVTPPLKWHGGKYYLAESIVSLMPPRLHYVEPFFGGGQVLFRRDPRNVSEVANDIHGRLMNFWSVLKEDGTFERFRRAVEATPFGQPEFEAAAGDLDHPDPVRRAVALFVRCRMSLAGRMKSFTGVTKTRTRRGMNNETSAWLSAIDGLPEVHARLKRVLILNRPAVEVIAAHDTAGTLYYCDPPYLPSTRASPDVYSHEMTADQHAELLEVLKKVKGKVILSGYPSELYDDMLRGWHRREFDLANHAAGGKAKTRQTEVVWMNYDPSSKKEGE